MKKTTLDLTKTKHFVLGCLYLWGLIVIFIGSRYYIFNETDLFNDILSGRIVDIEGLILVYGFFLLPLIIILTIFLTILKIIIDKIPNK